MYYFAYGSNLNQEQMHERCPDSKPLFIATLPNYKLVFSGYSRKWHGGVATIKAFRGERVSGAIYEVSEGDLGRLDRHEGPGYRRLNINVFYEDGEPTAAVTYIKAGQLEETRPAREYLALIQQGYRDWQIV
ncbi:gamma-glutamylcyclotransferase family protein [Chloroflexota bacterium]